MVQVGNRDALHVTNIFDSPQQHPQWVALEDGSIWSKEELWERLRLSLLDALAARQVARPRKGRPARGPGSAQLGGSAADRARTIRLAYDEITTREGRPAQYAEVARKLAMSPTTLWRWRQQNAWPPEAGSL